MAARPVKDDGARIAADLAALGVRSGGLLLVHSSLSSMGYVPGGPETVVLGLLEALGPEGTLLMPALTYERVTAKSPLFDVRRTPSNVGAIPEHFRRRPGTLRSLHPTHSVCGVGPQTHDMLDDHIQDTTPCGPHSPFRKLRDAQAPNGLGGQVLMLGCGLRPNTSMHAIEELAMPPYLFNGPLDYVLVQAGGVRIEKTYTTHGFEGWTQRYDRVAQVLEAPHLVQGPVLQATAHLIEARALWERVLSVMAHDPLYFVDRRPILIQRR